MGQHFLQSAAARTLSIKAILRMSEDEAYARFCSIRFWETEGQPVCIHCNCAAVYNITTRRKFKCKNCLRQFSVTSETVFADRKLSFVDLLHAMAVFSNGVKGVAALHMARHVEVQPKTAYVLLQKLRKCMSDVQQDQILDGQVEIDGAYYGGYIKPANLVKDRINLRLAGNQNGKRQVVVVMRERKGRSIPFVGKKEGDAYAHIVRKLDPDAHLFTDEHPGYKGLSAHFNRKTIDHKNVGFSIPELGISTNEAESCHLRLRRAEKGIYHHIAGPFLDHYAGEASWREDRRRISNGDQFLILAANALHRKKPEEWNGYWQRGPAAQRKKAERRRHQIALATI